MVLNGQRQGARLGNTAYKGVIWVREQGHQQPGEGKEESEPKKSERVLYSKFLTPVRTICDQFSDIYYPLEVRRGEYCGSVVFLSQYSHLVKL